MLAYTVKQAAYDIESYSLLLMSSGAQDDQRMKYPSRPKTWYGRMGMTKHPAKTSFFLLAGPSIQFGSVHFSPHCKFSKI